MQRHVFFAIKYNCDEAEGMKLKGGNVYRILCFRLTMLKQLWTDLRLNIQQNRCKCWLEPINI